MEDIVGVLIGSVAAMVGIFVGQRITPKNKTVKNMQDFYENSIETLRNEIRGLRARVSYYRKGAIPASAAVDDNPSALIDNVLSGMPDNWKAIIAPIRGDIVKLAEENPEAVKAMLPIIMKRVGGGVADKLEIGMQDAL